MPNMNGLRASFHVNEILKVDRQLSQAPNNICLLSSEITADTKMFAEKLDIRYTYEKPIPPKELNKVLTLQRILAASQSVI